MRVDWAWRAIEGSAVLVGPDEMCDAFDAERIRLLLRAIFTAAGGTHDDWDGYDRTMREQHRTAVLVTPSRCYGN